MLHRNVRNWTDLEDHSRFRNAIPNRIIRADEIANGEYDAVVGDAFHPGVRRKAVYIDTVPATDQRYEVDLVFYIHPVGAGAITLLAAGVSQVRGRLLDTSGAFTTTRDDAYLVAGGMLTHYTETSSFIGSSVAQEPDWATTLNEGDGIWLVESGRYEALVDAAVGAADIYMVTENGALAVDGAVDASVGTVANQAQVQEVITGIAGKCVGRSLAASVGGYLDMILVLPQKAVRTE